MRHIIHAVAVACLWVSGAALAVPAGYFHDVTGDVMMTPAGKPAVKVAIGDLFESGATVNTAANGKATLKFEDGEVVALSPNTDFVITNYAFNKEKPGEGSVFLKIAKGGMRFVTGLIGKTNPSKFSVQTPTVTAGVRGSEGEIVVAQSADGQFSVLVSSSLDTVTVTGPNGTVVLTAGNLSFTPAGSNQPSQPFTAGNAPPAAQALLNVAAQLLQAVLPSNTPVNATEQGQQRKNETGTPTNQSAAPPPAAAQAAQSLVTGAGGGGGGTTSPSK